MAEGGVMKGHGMIRTAIACALFFASLSLVVWRQSRALETLRALDAARSEHVMLESSRASLVREIQLLESRNRVVATAGARLGLHVPTGSEIVILQLPAQTSDRDGRAAPRIAMAVR
ncbi:MAG: hypothetical protein ABIV28_00670 [Longimicrobiales bacterium]